MTNTQPTSPENQEEIEKMEQKTPLETEIESTIEKFGGLLSEGFSKEVDEKDEKLKVLIMDFEEAVRKKSIESKFYYNIWNYETILGMNNEDYNNVFNNIILKDKKIYKLFNGIIGEYKGEGIKKHIKNKLMKNCVENLIYEFYDESIYDKRDERTEEDDYISIYPSESIYKQIMSKIDDDIINKYITEKKIKYENKNIINIDGEGINNFRESLQRKGFNIDKIEDFFINTLIKSLPKGLKCLNLDRCSIYTSNSDKFLNLIKNLPSGLKSLNLANTYISFEGNIDGLIKLGKSLPKGLKCLNLHECNLCNQFKGNPYGFKQFILNLPLGLKIVGVTDLDLDEYLNIRGSNLLDIYESNDCEINDVKFDEIILIAENRGLFIK